MGPRKLPRPTEHQEQVAVMAWAGYCEKTWPELSLLHAIPNAGAGAQRGQAGKMRAEGVKRGVPDLCLPVKRKAFSGLYIEMKRAGESCTVDQLAWGEALRAQGFKFEVAHGADIAIARLKAYLTLPK